MARTTSDDAPHWLSESEEQAWLGVAMLMLQVPHRLDAEMQRACGLTLFEYLVLSTLSMAPKRTLRMSELARAVNGSMSRLSNVVKRLEARGWVSRAGDSSDGRYTTATLTKSGTAIVVESAPAHVALVRHFVIDPLSPTQQRTLAAVGERLRPVLASP